MRVIGIITVVFGFMLLVSWGHEKDMFETQIRVHGHIKPLFFPEMKCKPIK